MTRLDFSTEVEHENGLSQMYNVAFGFNTWPKCYFIYAWDIEKQDRSEPDYKIMGSKSAITDSPFNDIIKEKYPEEYRLCMLDLPF